MQDYNGSYFVKGSDVNNAWWQGDYANVHFKFAPPERRPYDGKDLYITGQLTDYGLNEKTKMQFNTDKGYYECSLFLKQGYYSYGYTLLDKNTGTIIDNLNGNYWETENSYTILVYYKSFTDQADELIGVSKVNTRNDRPGFSF